MIGKFIFKGKNGSMGFKTGVVYTLDVRTSISTKGEYISVDNRPTVVYEGLVTAVVKCPYQSWKAFFKNWEPQL